MNIVIKAAIAFVLVISGLSASAQCTTCVTQDSLCPSATTGTDVLFCGDSIFVDTAGTSFEAGLTFLFNTGFVIREGDDLFAGLGIVAPFPFPFPSPFDISVYVERGTLNSITGLPAGLTWETDSSANGNNYQPFLVNRGCVKFCGTLECGQSGTFNAVMNFTTLSRQNLSGLPTLPIPGFALPDSTLNNYDLTVTFEIDPSTNNILSLTTSGPTTVIDSGETITLIATPGFESYLWSTGDTVATLNATPADTTWYIVTATDAVGCTQKDSMEVQVLSVVDSLPPTGITTAGYNSTLLKVYPNPSRGSFSVNIAKPLASTATVQVLDITGKVVYTDVLQSLNNTITLENAKGLYLVKVITGDNVFTQKLLIH